MYRKPTRVGRHVDELSLYQLPFQGDNRLHLYLAPCRRLADSVRQAEHIDATITVMLAGCNRKYMLTMITNLGKDTQTSTAFHMLKTGWFSS